MRVAVGTVLLGLGGCTPASSTTSSEGKSTPEKTEVKAQDKRIGEHVEAVNEGPVDPPKPPEPIEPKDGDCVPPDCHINPGPNEDPAPKPKPEPEPPKPEIKVNPGPEPTPPVEPKRVNTGPVDKP